MHLHRLKLRFRRDFRLRRRQLEGISRWTEAQLERNFMRRLGRLVEVRRFVIVWVLLVVLLTSAVIVQTRALTGYYQTLQPIPGGIYAEGIVGAFTNANPLYASGQVDDAVSHLIFSGLFKYNDKNHLVGDLAKSWSVDHTNEIYTVHLRHNVTWQDGKPLTAKDVVFTYQTIQNPDAQSPLNVSWQDVSISATNDYTVVFKLPNPLSSFIYSLTTGIIPQHILGNVPVDQLRAADFNTTKPIGSGPFRIRDLEVIGDTPQNRQEEIQLKPFAHYYAGEPKLATFIVHSFRSEKLMIKSFKKQSINAMVGLTTMPKSLKGKSSVQQYSMPITAANMVFFKTSTGVLSDKKVRQALVAGANTQQILQSLGYQAKPVNEPLLIGQLGYNPKYQQHTNNVSLANKLLSKDGWVMGKDGVRYKKNKPLTFGLYALNNSEYSMIANELKAQWHKLGVDVNVYLEQNTDMQATLSQHNYDALLYGISIGIDPDVFVYWDSSQADVRSDSRLNFSEYSSPVADASLEAGRTRTKSALRAIKYQSFLKAWQQDAPALGLYQPRFLYITRGRVFGLTEHTLNVDTDRYDNVQNWMIRQALRNVAKS